MLLGADRLFHIFDVLDYHVAIYDTAWRYTYVNAEAARVLGRAPEELIGRSIWELFPEAVGNQYYRELHAAMSEGRTIHSDHFYPPFNRWFENHIYPLPDGVVVLARDVTAERNAAAAQRVREDVHRLAQRAGGMATFEWDFAHQVAVCSAEFFRIFGLPEHDGMMATSEWAEFVHPDDRPRLREHLHRALAGDEPAAADYRIVRGDGSIRWLSYVGQVQRGPEGERMLGTVIDVTERKRLETELRRHADENERLLESRDQFLATLSHELRTPLNVILGYARMLRNGDIAPDKREHALEVIERNAAVQTQLVNDLLDISRITTGKVSLTLEPAVLPLVVQEALDGVRLTADAKQLSLALDIEPGLPLIVRGDTTRLQQVFANLLGNAVKFTGPGGSVTATIRREREWVVAVVADTGEGIEPELLPLVFEAFRQGGSPRRGQGGLGLGLAISRQLVELHGGSITASSAGAGRGATFTVRLPVSQDAAGSGQATVGSWQ